MRIRQKIILVIALLLIGEGIFYLVKSLQRRKQISFDYLGKGCQIDSVVNQILAKCSISPVDILEQHNEERQRAETTWIERTRLVRIPNQSVKERLLREIQAAMERIDVELFPLQERKGGREVILSLGLNDIPLETLTFRQEARLAIVIDDFGYQRELAEKFFQLPFPLTCAVLPRLKYSRELAKLASTYQKEVWLHLPLQPYGYPQIDPGRGALFVDMTPEQIREVFEKDLATVPGAKGVDNHMGSKFTEHSLKMSALMEIIQEKGLCFLDEVTSPKSVAYEIAQGMGVRSAERTLVLDAEQHEAKDIKYIQNKLQELVEITIEKGEAIAVGHLYESTYEALFTFYPEFDRQGINLVFASELMH